MSASHESLPFVPRLQLVYFGILSLGGAQMGVDYGWEKFFSSIHYAVTSTEHLQQRLQVVVSGIDGLRRDRFSTGRTQPEFEKPIQAPTFLPTAGDDGPLPPSTS